MQTSHLLALLALALVAAVWATVQIAWRRAFPHACADPDVLAGRIGCHGCASAQECERRKTSQGEEERR